MVSRVVKERSVVVWLADLRVCSVSGDTSNSKRRIQVLVGESSICKAKDKLAIGKTVFLVVFNSCEVILLLLLVS
jgi:hypothetical protein